MTTFTAIDIIHCMGDTAGLQHRPKLWPSCTRRPLPACYIVAEHVQGTYEGSIT